MGRIEFNVNVTKQELDNLKISKENIENIINDIQKLYSSLDDNIWLSEEKKKLDEYLIPYLIEKKNYHMSRLNNYNESLRIYTEGYQNLINKISGSVNNG